jgi:hypothetical protein
VAVLLTLLNCGSAGPVRALAHERRPQKIYLYCTMPITMGILVMLAVFFFAFIGNYGLMTTSPSERMPSTADKFLHIPANN